MIKRLKGKIKHYLNESPSASGAADSQARQIESVVNEQFAALDQSRIKLEQTREEIIENGRLPEAPFAYFLGHYEQVRGGHDKKALDELKQGHPFFCAFSEMAINYLNKCDQMPAAIAPLLRRHFFKFITFFNSPDASNIFDYKKHLPRVGLCYFPNPGPRQFLIDALLGMADIEDMEPGKIFEKAWNLQGYDFDFATYEEALRAKMDAQVDLLPADFIARFPSRKWLVNDLVGSMQYQWGLVKLLERGHYDLIFLGASETPLALALYDLPREILPPIVNICHGIPSGDPLMSFFARLDHIIVRCQPEKDFYADLGVAEEKMFFVGSTSTEDFPSRSASRQARENSRAKLGLDECDKVILYATTYDINIYDTKSPPEVMALLLDTFKKAAACGLKNPVLYVKYHPSPASDPNFSFSRNQYPFEAFDALNAIGYRVRLTNSIEEVLPACDLFLAHESTTMSEALDCGIPTISIKMHNGIATPFLGKLAYSETTCHKHFSVYDTGDLIGKSVADLCAMDRDEVYNQTSALWRKLFVHGRSQGLMKVAQLTRKLLAEKSS